MLGKIFSPLNISASAIHAERQRMNLIANNLANANTTRGPDGLPYRRKIAVFESVLNNSQSHHASPENQLGGVKINEIAEDPRPFVKVHKPGHPDADAEGYVLFPNVNVVEENVDMMAASRSYEANLSVLKQSKAMIKRVLDLMTTD